LIARKLLSGAFAIEGRFEIDFMQPRKPRRGSRPRNACSRFSAPDKRRRVALEPERDRASLRFGRYARAARRWATVLPAVLDRHPKDKPGEYLAAIIAQASINIELPPKAVDGIDIEVHKHSAIAAAPSVKDVRQALPSDSRYREKPICHLVLTFPRPIRGPLTLGAGRFRGLGLCLPLDDGAPS